MRAWVVRAPGRIDQVELEIPRPADDELLVRVRACGVCRTDLHIRDGDLPPHRTPVVPGHEAVGEVIAAGERAAGHPLGARVGVPWLRRTCGRCRFCVRGQENLCPSSVYTGWDADGGYAPYVTVPAEYAYELPAGYADEDLAPLLCAGILGYRALRRAALPAGGRLGLYGFGGSAHLTAQVPPTFILQNEDDHVDGINQSLVYYIALKNAGVPVEMHLYAQGGHAFGLRPTKLPVSHWPQLVETWLVTIGITPQ